MSRLWRLKSRLRRSEPPDHRDHDEVLHEPLRQAGSNDQGLASLGKLIESQEHLVRELSAAVAAQQTVLQSLYRSAGLDTPIDVEATPLAFPTGSGPDLVSAQTFDIEAKLFGLFRLDFQGKPQKPWASQRATSLLKFLLLHPAGPARREELMTAFWPNSSAKSARNNLNAAVYQLRSRLRELDSDRSHIIYTAGSYAISPELKYRTDVEDYLTAVAAGVKALQAGEETSAARNFRMARSFYAGPLLEDDASGDWYVESQRRLHLEHCALLERLGRLLLDQAEIEEAIVIGNELLEADPCRETGHQLLMCAYAELRQPQLVVEQFQRCAEMMRRELSAAPAESTVDLFRRLVPGYRCPYTHP